MRGKTRALTRFNRFKEDILTRFSNATRNPGISHSNFIYFLENQNFLELELKAVCDSDECLDFDQQNSTTALYQIFRLVDKRVLLRDLETLSDTIWNDKMSLYTALSILVSLNLIDYEQSIEGQIENSLQFFIKEDE
jgi:hypothetical protein